MFGRIDVQSEIGKGSAFTVVLPLRHAEEQVSTPQPDLSDRRVVISSEDPDTINMLDCYLRACGAVPEKVPHGQLWQQRAAVYIVDCSLQAKCCWPATLPGPVLCLTAAEAPLQNAPEGVQLLEMNPLCRSSLVMSLLRLQGTEPAVSSLSIGPLLSRSDTNQHAPLLLLAEDNPLNQKVLVEQLQTLGYRVEVADDGQIALDKWRQYRYPLLLTDLHMPNLSGYDLTRAIRKEAAQYDDEEIVYTRIVAITANALKGEAQKCLSVGMDDYLTKPIELAKLNTVLQRWLPLPSATEHNASPAGPVAPLS